MVVMAVEPIKRKDVTSYLERQKAKKGESDLIQVKDRSAGG